MKRAFPCMLLVVLASCGGGTASQKPAETVGDTSMPPADPPVDPTTKTDKAADAAPAGPTKASDGAGEAWSGEAEAKTPSAAGASDKPETRTMEVIAQVVKDNRKGVRDCFEKAKKELPDLKGDMVIHFVINPEGKVRTAELNIERSTLKSPAVADCSIKVIQGIKFPPSSRGMDTTVNYPFNLN